MRPAPRRRRFDDPDPPTSSLGVPHFEALCRGVMVVVALAAPVGLTLAFAPPSRGHDGACGSVTAPSGALKAAGWERHAPRVVPRLSWIPRASGAAGRG